MAFCTMTDHARTCTFGEQCFQCGFNENVYMHRMDILNTEGFSINEKGLQYIKIPPKSVILEEGATNAEFLYVDDSGWSPFDSLSAKYYLQLAAEQP